MRSVRAIEHCDVAILVLDATRGFDGQVQKIFWLAQKNNKGVVFFEKRTHIFILFGDPDVE